MKFSALLAFVGALPLPARAAHFTDWKKPLGAIVVALHESRRREAARHIRRHQYLLDRYATPSSQRTAAQPSRDDMPTA